MNTTPVERQTIDPRWLAAGTVLAVILTLIPGMTACAALVPMLVVQCSAGGADLTVGIDAYHEIARPPTTKDS